MEELLKHNLEEGYYYMCQPNLILRLPIVEVSQSSDGITLELGIDGYSSITIWKDASEVIEVRRPDMIIAKFEWCYLIKNEYKENIGYIGN